MPRRFASTIASRLPRSALKAYTRKRTPSLLEVYALYPSTFAEGTAP
jgi:hypothetical protein